MRTKRGDDVELQMIASRLRCRRKEIGLSQQDVAGRVGLTRTMLNQLEMGRAPIPLEHLPALAQALALEPKDIMFSADWENERLRATVQLALLPGPYRHVVLTLIEQLLHQ
jgi:transcriptional regulator with XRE-family HTH domain